MPGGEPAHRPRRQSAYVAGSWIMLATVAASLAVALALPVGWESEPTSVRDVFHPEWVVLATLAAIPVYRAARACWWSLLPAVALPMAQLGYAVETAGLRLDSVELGSDPSQWWLLTVGQGVVLLCGALLGARQSLRDRRWEKFMLRRLGAQAAEVANRFDTRA